jgi:uncharacterized protein (DUF362 family)
MSDIDRRAFLAGGLALGAATLTGVTSRGSASAAEAPDLLSIKGKDAFAASCKAVDGLGGMGRFVTRGARVGLLVNAPRIWKLPGTYTHPEVVLAIAKMCLDAGAKGLVALCALAPNYWKRTPLAEKYAQVARAISGPSGEHVERQVDRGLALKKALVAKDLLDVDVFVNLPVAKHHEGCQLTGNLKNFMGALDSETCQFFHKGSARAKGGYYDDVEFLSQCIADVNTLRRPALCVVDATEVLSSNGPQGPGDLLALDLVAAGTDPVALDAYAAGLHRRRPSDIPMIVKAAAHGLGHADMTRLTVREL